jgi:hypothetical protein
MKRLVGGVAIIRRAMRTGQCVAAAGLGRYTIRASQRQRVSASRHNTLDGIIRAARAQDGKRVEKHAVGKRKRGYER